MPQPSPRALAAFAALIADSTRAAFLLALLDGLAVQYAGLVRED